MSWPSSVTVKQPVYRVQSWKHDKIYRFFLSCTVTPDGRREDRFLTEIFSSRKILLSTLTVCYFPIISFAQIYSVHSGIASRFISETEEDFPTSFPRGEVTLWSHTAKLLGWSDEKSVPLRGIEPRPRPWKGHILTDRLEGMTWWQWKKKSE
jgi:hypothetical protein